MIEKDFVTEGLKRTRIDEYLEKDLEPLILPEIVTSTP